MTKKPAKKGGAKAPPPSSGKDAGTGKRQRDYAAEYARRVKGTKPGTRARQEARGHKEPQESKRRRERELERGGLTSAQIQAIRRFALKHAPGQPDDAGGGQAARIATDPHDSSPPSPEQVYAMLLAWARRSGWEAFVELRTEVKDLNRDMVQSGPDLLAHRAEVRDLMEQLAEDWDLPDWRLLFYH